MCLLWNTAYTSGVPRLWNETIETHRHEVRETILDTAAALVAEGGLLAVTMSRIAEQVGIGRATLYKYFPDVESIVLAWHERQIAAHLQILAEARDRASEPATKLAAVLEAYGFVSHESHAHHDPDLAAFLHRDARVMKAHHHLLRMVRDLVVEAMEAGHVRKDVSPDELAAYCIHALSAARTLRSKSAVRRLVDITLAGLRSTN